MRKNRILSFIGLLSMLGGLVSCGRDKPSTSDETPSTYETIIPTTKPTSKVTINFWHTSGKALTEALEARFDKFEKMVKENEGVDVEIVQSYQGAYTDIENKVIKGFSTGNYPTIAVAYPDHVADYIDAENGIAGKYVVNLDPYINSDYGFGKEAWIGDGEASDFVKAFYDEGKSYRNEGTYSLPLMKSSEALFYNKRIVGLYASQYDPSLTGTEAIDNFMKTLSWDKFMDFCRFIKSKDSSLEVPFMYDSDSNLFISKCYQNNIDFLGFDENGNGQVLFNNDKAKAMVQKLKDSYDEGLFKTKGSSDNTYSSDKFKNETCAFTVGSTGGAGYVYPTGESFEVGVVPVPYDNNNPLYVTQGITTTILRTPDDKDGYKAFYAFKLLKYLTSAEVNADLCVNGSEGYSPVRNSAYETDLYAEYLLNEGEDFMPKVAKIVYEDIAGKYFNTPCFSGTATARTQVGGIITQVLLGNKTIDAAFSDAENQTKLAL